MKKKTAVQKTSPAKTSTPLGDVIRIVMADAEKRDIDSGDALWEMIKKLEDVGTPEPMKRLKTDVAAKREEADKLAQTKIVTLQVRVKADNYGLLAAGGIIHDCTPTETVEIMLNSSDILTEWANSNYVL